jgi:uncharacterized zinc-type alcohol dehydrogenase-like protein
MYKNKSIHKARAHSAASATPPLASTTNTRRNPAEHDVQIEILSCGICHSDLHQVRNEGSGFIPTVYPCVPGHEIVGRVTKIASAVSKFKPGDLAAVDCVVDTVSSSTRGLSCASPRTSISPEPVLCFAPVSEHTHLCVTGASQRTKKSAWSVQAD